MTEWTGHPEIRPLNAEDSQSNLGPSPNRVEQWISFIQLY